MPMWFYQDSSGGAVTITYQDHAEVGPVTQASHTFTAMGIGTGGSSRYVIACITFAGTGLSVSSVTIDGITATQVGSTAGPQASVYTAMFIALVGNAHTTGDVVINLAGGNGLAFACTTNSITGISSLTAAQTATSTASAPTASMTCLANGAIIGCANAQGAGTAPTSSWAGIASDKSTNYYTSNTLCFTSAHTNFSTAQSGLSCTCTFTLFSTALGSFAAFNPS